MLRFLANLEDSVCKQKSKNVTRKSCTHHQEIAGNMQKDSTLKMTQIWFQFPSQNLEGNGLPNAICSQPNQELAQALGWITCICNFLLSQMAQK